MDTDVLVAHLRGAEAVSRRLEAEAGRWCISTVTHFELLKGVALATRGDEARIAVSALLARVVILPLSAEVNELAAANHATLRRAGSIVPDPDLLIAATAQTNRLALVTGNTAHFSRIPGLTI